MNPEIKRCLALLDKLVEEKNKRLFDLLSCSNVPSGFQNPYDWPSWCDEWSFNVGPQFANALDIQLTQRVIEKKSVKCWTQGSSFDFKKGYFIHTYPNSLAEKKWGEQLANNPISIMIEDASPVIPADEYGARNGGKVIFRILKRHDDGTSLVPAAIHETTQDGFVRFLITGELS